MYAASSAQVSARDDVALAVQEAVAVPEAEAEIKVAAGAPA
jgi:hypothetical protein